MTTGHPANCRECQPCEACGQAAFCLSEVVPHPCPHNGIWCGACNVENCLDCRREAFADMCATGDYDARADVLYDHTKTAEAQRLWQERREGTTFDPVTNSHRPRSGR